MNTTIPRLVVGAAASGAGKSSWTLGLLAAFARRGLEVQPFKAGPDYLDPALHSLLSRRVSRNLDTRMLSEGTVRRLFSRAASGADLALVEGVMGYYDGAGPGDARGSTADLARVLDAPAVLVLDVRSSAASAGAVALGFLRYRRNSRVRGFLLNRVGSPRHLETVRQAVEGATGLPVYGYLPKDATLALPERHLGLVGGGENAAFAATVDRLADRLEEHTDLDALVALARSAPPLRGGSAAQRPESEALVACGGPRIAVARDAAFSFYYQDNLEDLTALGATLVPFSPVAGETLPPRCSGVYLGGGYPELHARALAENRRLAEDLRVLARSGLPILAECGGYMYLCAAIVDSEGSEHPMAGLFSDVAVMGNSRAALGYYDGTVLTPSVFAPEGAPLGGHCFRWSGVRPSDDDGEAGPALLLSKGGTDTSTQDGRVLPSVFASYLHIHFSAHPGFAKNFVRACGDYARRTYGPT